MIELTADNNRKYSTVDFEDNVNYADIRANLEAMVNTAERLEKEHVPVAEPKEPTPAIRETLEAIANTAADEDKALAPKQAKRAMTAIEQATIAEIKEAKRVLDIYETEILPNMVAMKNQALHAVSVVLTSGTNAEKLKAADIIFKMKDVGVYDTKSEITITHRASDELRDMVAEKLAIARERKRNTHAKHALRNDGVVVVDGEATIITDDEELD